MKLDYVLYSAPLWVIFKFMLAPTGNILPVRKKHPDLDKLSERDLPPEQFLILVECTDEAEQLNLLRRFQDEGLKCQAKIA